MYYQGQSTLHAGRVPAQQAHSPLRLHMIV